jgi:hypothetical protein
MPNSKQENGTVVTVIMYSHLVNKRGGDQKEKRRGEWK